MPTCRRCNAWCSFRTHTLKMSDRPNAPLELKIRMLRAEVLETMLYGCVTWNPRAGHYDTLRRAHHKFLTRCIGCRKTIALTTRFPMWTRLSRREVRASRRRILFAGFVTRMNKTRLPKCVTLGELMGGTGRKKSGRGVSWTTSELSVSTPTSGGLQPRTRGNGARRRNKGRNVKVRAGPRHAVVCPNVTGRTKEIIAQIKRARTILIVD